ACGGSSGARIRKLSPALQHDTPMLESRTLPELRVVHAFVRWSPAPPPFLDRHPQVLWGHPVFDEPFRELWIGIVLAESQAASADLLARTGGPSRHWQQASDVVQLFIGFPQMGVDAGRIQDEDHLP